MSPSYEVMAVRYATWVTRAAEVYLNFHTYREADHELVLDYFFWVARNGDHTVVVDTGFSPEVGGAKGKSMTCPVPHGLRRLGIDPASVDTVVITHGHFDHTGNIGLFENASIVMSNAELDFWSGPVARRFQFAHSAEWQDIEALHRLETNGRLRRIAGTHVVAPGITAIEVGGHTPGQLIVVVDGEGGPVLLASDAVHLYDEVGLDRPFLMVADLPRMYQAFDTISKIAGHPGTAFVAGHDPIVFDRFTALDPADPRFGVRVG